MKNNTTQEQKSLLESLSQGDKSVMRDLQDIWDKSASYQPKVTFNKDAAYTRFMDNIHKDISTSDAATSSSVGKIVLRSAIAIAAAALLFFLYTQIFSYKTIKTTDNIEFAMLEDGTEVWLNKYSELKYPKSFATNSREVSLKGEAFFDVERNEDSPFSVNLSNDNLVTVLGTSFNINDKFDSKVEVSVNEGKVNLRNSSINSLSQDISKGEKGILNVSKNVITREVFAGNLSAWKETELKFNAEPIESILEDVGSFYGVQFKFDNAEVDCSYTTMVSRDQSLDETIGAVRTSFTNIIITKAGEKLYYVQGTCK